MTPNRTLALLAAPFLMSACGAEERTTVDTDDAAARPVGDTSVQPVGDAAPGPNFDARPTDAATDAATDLGPRLEVCPPEEPAAGAACVEGLSLSLIHI